MTPGRWQKIESLLQAALERNLAERGDFLDRACAGDEAMRKEVESLLASSEPYESFLKSPAFEDAAILFADDKASSMLGQRIGSYQIISQLGAGGMGEVYLAQDARLGRKVALKILPARFTKDEQRLRRFQQEARAASALNHPNIITLFDIGQNDSIHYIATEYIEGDTLRAMLSGGRMKLVQAIDVAIQVASAIASAHQAGIVHRDIKPENIMVRPDGYVKVLDFGLAKLTQKAVSTADTEALTIAKVDTDPGTVMGTASYMSPEQARGREVDSRTDTFSVGVVLYEMIAGRVPFEGESTSDVIAAILEKQPPPIARYEPDAPAEMQWIVTKALRKDKEERYQTIKEMLSDLKDLRQQQEHPKKAAHQSRSKRGHPNKAVESLAVLALANTSNDPNMEYLADGITETIINSLSQLPRLKVMARSTVFRYKSQAVDPQEIGRALGVSSVLSGRVLQLGDTLIIGVELVNVADGSQLWGEQYRRKLSDIFELQEEVAEEILKRLRLKLTGGEKKRLTKRYTENTEAYHLYLKGLFYWNKRTPDGLNAAIGHFQEAITIDPGYALAYSGLAHCYILQTTITGIPSRETYPKAKAAAEKALEIDEALAEAYIPLAQIKFFHDWDWAGAGAEYRRAIELNPNYATARHYYSIVLVYMERFDEAFEQYKMALRLDPLSLPISSSLGWALYSARRYDEAIEQCEKALKVDPNFARTHLYLGEIYVQKRMYDEAIAEFHMAERLSRELWASVELAHAYGASGRRDEAEKILAELRGQPELSNISPFQMAIIYAGLGEKDQALELLEEAYDQHNHGLVELKVEPMLDSLRSDPRFQELIRRVGFQQ